MAYVITESCIGSKHGTCTDVCPVDCIHPAPGESGFEEATMLYIDPSECIDCDACVQACPEGAPMSAGDARGAMAVFTEINRAYGQQGLAAAEALLAGAR
ncbi:MAG: 4Fe-4S dicluster domain-containing protein [Miltoncostaeaceae bacterium]